MAAKRKSVKDSTHGEITTRDPLIVSSDQADNQGDLIALFRLLLRNPPKDHDFRTCTICKQYGIDEI
jgi:hypothetical protein